MGPKNIGVTTLTFLGHVTPSVAWQFGFPGAISYRCSIVTVSLSNHFRNNGHFYTWVTTLTFLGHVTSSFTWPIDPPYVISYVSHNRTSISNRFRDIWPPKPVRARAHTHTHRHTPQVILYWNWTWNTHRPPQNANATTACAHHVLSSIIKL